MRYSAASIPDHIKRMASPADWKALGIDPRTMEQVVADNQVKSEKELHQQIMQELNRRGIWYCHSRTDKRTTQNCGVPDFLFCLRPGSMDGCAMAFECKVGDNDLSLEQQKARVVMEKNGWHYWVVRNLQQAIEILKQFGA